MFLIFSGHKKKAEGGNLTRLIITILIYDTIIIY